MIAAAHFVGLRPVLRRQAFHGVGDAAPDEPQAVARIGRAGLICKPKLIQSPVQQDARVVAGERPPGAVRAVHARSKAHDEELRPRRSEGRHRPRMVTGMLSPDGVQELGEPRAVPAGGIESGPRNRFRHDGVWYRISPFFTTIKPWPKSWLPKSASAICWSGKSGSGACSNATTCTSAGAAAPSCRSR